MGDSEDVVGSAEPYGDSQDRSEVRRQLKNMTGDTEVRVKVRDGDRSDVDNNSLSAFDDFEGFRVGAIMLLCIVKNDCDPQCTGCQRETCELR